MKLMKTKGRILVSALTAILFILIAIASDLDSIAPDERQLDDGRWESVQKYSSNSYTTTIGKRDNKKKWHGEVEIIYEMDYFTNSKEFVNFEHGERNGWSTTIYYKYNGEEYFRTEKYYVLGVEVSSKTVNKKASSPLSPHDILYQRYYWFHTALHSRGFDSLYVREFMDTLMLLLDSMETTIEDFDDSYGDALDVLEETPRDSLLSFNSKFTIYSGLERIKNNEYRMAVIDKYLSGAESTFQVLQEEYPNYLSGLEEYEVTPEDFQSFSYSMDSIMVTYSPLDTDDPWFVDSVDSRLYRAIGIIQDWDEEEKGALAGVSQLLRSNRMFSIARDHVSRIIRKTMGIKDMAPPDVADVVVTDILSELLKANLLEFVVREAWMLNHGEISLPVLTTEFLGSFTGSGAQIRGLILEDGGDVVSDRGIIWAAHHNPDMEDQVEQAGTGTGEFTVSLGGLEEGERYYCRAYAINSAGTALGPVVEFIAGSSVGTEPETADDPSLLIYPNPASSLARLSLTLAEPSDISVHIYDLRGRLMDSRSHGRLAAGAQSINLDVSRLATGTYLVEVRCGQLTFARGQLIVGYR